MSRETHTGKVGVVGVWPGSPYVQFTDNERNFQCNSETEFYVGERKVDASAFIVWFQSLGLGDEDMVVVTETLSFGVAVEVRLVPTGGTR